MGQSSTLPRSKVAQYSALQSSTSAFKAKARSTETWAGLKEKSIFISQLVLQIHHLAVILVHGANSRFRDQRIGRTQLAFIQLDDVHLAAGTTYPFLHKLHGLVVFQTQETGRTHQVALTQTVTSHLLGIVLIAKHGPLHDQAVGAIGHDLTHTQGVHLALNNQVGPDRLHGHRPRRIKLLDVVQETLIAQTHIVHKGTHFLLVVLADL